jgi:predicted HicB family RNase H-like nuclease
MKDYMEYKGYAGKISYCQEDQVFYGTILGINDLITFEGKSVEELILSFKEAIEDYLEMCKKHSKEPEKTYKGQFNVRINPDLHKDIALKSAMQNISLNQYVENALKMSIQNKKGK